MAIATELFKKKFSIATLDSGEKIVVSSYRSKPTVEQTESLLADESVDDIAFENNKLFEVDNG